MSTKHVASAAEQSVRLRHAYRKRKHRADTTVAATAVLQPVSWRLAVAALEIVSQHFHVCPSSPKGLHRAV